MSQGRPPPELEPLYSLFRHDRRRRIVRTLATRSGPTTRDELARTLRSDDPRLGTREEVASLLYHVDLPKLDEADVVRYDPDADSVTITKRGLQMAQYLRDVDSVVPE